MAGVAGSMLSQNPLPLAFGLGGCLPVVNTQQIIGNEFQVNNHTADKQEYPSVASFSNGNFVVAWESRNQDGSSWGIYGQLFYGNGTKFRNEFQVNTYTSGSQEYPSIAAFDNGNFVVVWESYDQDGSNYGIYGQLFYANSAKFGNEFQVNTYTSGAQRSSSVASFDNNNFIVAWDSDGQDGSYEGIYGQLFYRNSTKLGNEFQINPYVTSRQKNPSVASFSNGNFVVAWQSDGQDGNGYGIYGQVFGGNANRIGNEFQINNYTNSDQVTSSVASFNNGNFVVTWKSRFRGVYGQLFDGNANRIENEFQVNTHTYNGQSNPSMASFSNENFVVIWESDGQDGHSWGLYGQLFDSNINSIGGEFQVNTYITNWQIRPSVKTFSNGNFVVAWESSDQDGSDFGIYGQLFEGPLITSSTTSTTSETPTSSSSTVLSTTSNQPTSTTISSSYNPSTSTSNQPSSSTSEVITSSSSTPISSTSNQPTSTLPTTTAITSTTSLPTTFTTTTEEILTSIPGSSSVVWISLGVIGGLFCIALGGGAFYILQRRKKDQPDVEEDTDFKMKPVTEIGHKKIGGKYFQLSKITKKEAEEIYEQTGYMIRFPKAVKKIPYIIGRGKFGTTKLAQKTGNSEYVVSKKVKGEKNITASKEEAELQKAAKGDNVLPIYNTIELDDAIYHFMPLAGYGNGIEIQQQLSALNNHVLATEISKFIAKDLLTGLQTMHSKGIYHLDIKPENIVFDKIGAAFVTDFGCAKKLGDSNDQVSSRALGDNRYFSPERLQSCKSDSATFDPEKADVWAAGLTLLQMIKGKSPCDLLRVPLNFTKRLKTCTPGHFLDSLDQFEELKSPEKGTTWWVIKRMLDTNPETRLTAKELLQTPCFKGLSDETKSNVFEDMRADKFLQRGIKRKELNMGNYQSISKCIEEIAKAPYNKEEESADANILFDKMGESYANYPKREEQHYANLSFVQ